MLYIVNNERVHASKCEDHFHLPVALMIFWRSRSIHFEFVSIFSCISSNVALIWAGSTAALILFICTTGHTESLRVTFGGAGRRTNKNKGKPDDVHEIWMSLTVWISSSVATFDANTEYANVANRWPSSSARIASSLCNRNLARARTPWEVVATFSKTILKLFALTEPMPSNRSRCRRLEQDERTYNNWNYGLPTIAADAQRGRNAITYRRLDNIAI